MKTETIKIPVIEYGTWNKNRLILSDYARADISELIRDENRGFGKWVYSFRCSGQLLLTDENGFKEIINFGFLSELGD